MSGNVTVRRETWKRKGVDSIWDIVDDRFSEHGTELCYFLGDVRWCAVKASVRSIDRKNQSSYHGYRE